jgi:hypothetical protein
MIVITDIQYQYCTESFGINNNQVRIIHNGNLENEIIIGQVYINNKGEKISLGMSQKVQEFLALPVTDSIKFTKTIKNLLDLYIKESNYNLNSTKQLEKLKMNISKATFFNRLKYFITGNIKQFIE